MRGDGIVFTMIVLIYLISLTIHKHTANPTIDNHDFAKVLYNWSNHLMHYFTINRGCHNGTWSQDYCLPRQVDAWRNWQVEHHCTDRNTGKSGTHTVTAWLEYPNEHDLILKLNDVQSFIMFKLLVATFLRISKFQPWPVYVTKS